MNAYFFHPLFCLDPTHVSHFIIPCLWIDEWLIYNIIDWKVNGKREVISLYSIYLRFHLAGSVLVVVPLVSWSHSIFERSAIVSLNILRFDAMNQSISSMLLLEPQESVLVMSLFI